LTEEHKQIVILGAGVAGLAAAYRLLQLRPHWKVTLLEEAATPGGLASAWKLGAFTADLGPHRVYTELPEIQALLPELITKDEMLTVKRESQILIGGHFYQYPVKPTELLRHMGPVKMTGFATGMARGKMRALQGEPTDYEDAMIRAFGNGVYNLIIGPYTEKVWKIKPAELSEEVARVRVSAGNASKLVATMLGRGKKEPAKPTALKNFTYIKGGVQGLVKTLVDKVEAAGGVIRTNQIVVGLKGTSGQVTEVVTQSCTPPLPADAVISTLPISDLTEMVSTTRLSPGDGITAMAAADQLEYIGLILVAIMINRPQVTPNSWIYFPEKHLIFNRAYEPGNFDPGMKPEGQSMLVFEVTARWSSSIWRMKNEEIIEQVKRDAVSTGLFSEADINDAAALRVPHTYPLYTKDFRVHLQTLCDYLRPVTNLITTGRQGLFNHNNMDHSMLMGIRAAEVIAENPANTNPWYDTLDQFSHFRIVD